MCNSLWDLSDKLDAEDKVQQAVDYLRYTERGKTSVYKRNLNRNIVIREMKFLKENFPDSHMCEEDFSDIDFVIEE